MATAPGKRDQASHGGHHTSASPTRPPICNIKLVSPTGKLAIVNYASKSAVRTVIEHIIQHDAIEKYYTSRSAALKSGITITTDVPIDDILEWPLTPTFDFENTNPQSFRAVQAVMSPSALASRRLDMPNDGYQAPSNDASSDINHDVHPMRKRNAKPNIAANATPAPAKPPKAPRQPKTVKTPPADAVIARGGPIQLSTICQQAGVEPRLDRVKLRAQGMRAPQGGWSFAEDEVERIIELITRE